MDQRTDDPLAAAAASPTNGTPAPLDDDPDGSDAALARAGDEAALGRLCERHRPMLLRAALRIARDESEAEDAVQDALLSAVRAIGGFQGQSRVSTWLYRITVNAALQRRRRARSAGVRSVEALQPDYVDGMHARLPNRLAPVTPEGGSGIEGRERLVEAIAQLPDEFAEAVIMKDVAGMSSAQIAVAVGASDALVRQRIHRGRLALVKLLSSPSARSDP